MRNSDRSYGTLAALVALTISFWLLILFAIINTRMLAPYAMGVYVISVIYLAHHFVDKIWRKIVFVVLFILMQLIPYIIILLIKGLL